VAVILCTSTTILFKVGVRNVEVARQVLNQFEIPVVARHIGGTSGRKIIFNTSTGKVKMILLNKAAETPHETPNKGSHY
jgi:Chemotaxis protein; stimulates methylation of MCP proteins